jgi:hypothetical protein
MSATMWFTLNHGTGPEFWVTVTVRDCQALPRTKGQGLRRSHIVTAVVSSSEVERDALCLVAYID